MIRNCEGGLSYAIVFSDGFERVRFYTFLTFGLRRFFFILGCWFKFYVKINGYFEGD